jgi:peptidoglycan glycosyltransferase
MRHVVVVLLACFSLLFLQLNRVQVLERTSLRDHPENTRALLQDFDRARADIATSDGVMVATSEDATSGQFDLQRVYPEGDLYAHSVGYVAFSQGAEGAERAFEEEITGQTPAQELSNLIDLLDPKPDIGTVVLTLDHGLQQVAKGALAERVGSVVALDPRDGRVLALWSYPSFDPNRLANNDVTTSNEAFIELQGADGNPLRAASFREVRFPGSTFKVIPAAAALDTDAATLTEPVWPAVSEYVAPLTSRGLSNFGGRNCGGDLTDILVLSCNTAFAELAAEELGPEVMINQAEAAGFNQDIPFDLPGGVSSVFPTDYGEQIQAPSADEPAGLYENTPRLAQTAIGQNDVSATPLQMALVISAVANDGVVPTPHVLAEVLDPDGRTLSTNAPGPWRQAMQEDTARDLQTALEEAARSGSGSPAAVDGLRVGAKTGTAQLGTDPPRSHAWIVAFAGRPDSEPELAVAVLVESQEGDDQTGGRVAGPIARQLFEHWFSQPEE